MSAPSGSAGRRTTTLEWMVTASGGLAWVYVGPLYMEVDVEGYWHIQSGSGGERPRGKATDLVSAQIAAESAARDLLCSALAAFADGGTVPKGWRVEPWPGEGVLFGSHVLRRADARCVALALLKAAEEP